MRKKRKEEEVLPAIVELHHTESVQELQAEIEILKAELREEREKNEKVFSALHAKQREVDAESQGSRVLREVLTEEKRVLQQAAETARNCLSRSILPAHKWMQMGQMEAYAAAANRLEEALRPTVVSPPPSEGFLKAQQQLAELITKAAEQYLPITDEGSSPGIEKGYEFPPVPCPFCDKEPAKNWLSRHIKDEHPHRFPKWERERVENE